MRKSPLNSLGNDVSKQQKNFCWKDEFNVIHLVMAAKGTLAGDYYNSSILTYLKKGWILIIARKRSNFVTSL